MPTFVRGETSIHYQVHDQVHAQTHPRDHGSEPAVLLLAPGGMRSCIAFWDRAPFHPVRELARDFRVIAVDQRNAGQSRAPVHPADGWGTYAADQLGLMDQLGIERFLVLGACIGGAFALALAAAAPGRILGAVLQQPIGLDGGNRALFHQLFDDWAEELGRTRTDLQPIALAGLKANLFGGDFVFSVPREDVRRCAVPLLVLRGNDAYHPSAISEEIAHIAPRSEIVARWKDGEFLAPAVARVKAFLTANAARAGADARGADGQQ